MPPALQLRVLERQALGEWWFKQEYECQFISGQFALFSPDTIDAIFTDDGPEGRMQAIFTDERPVL